MISRILFIAVLVVLHACAMQTQLRINPTETQTETPKVQALEQVPSELSIPHFRTMLLSGSGLELERVLETNDIYTKYAINYRSNKLKITGVFLLPRGDGPYPLLIFNHGYIDPAAYTQGRGLKREEDYMARQGFAVLHTDYRGHAGSDPSPMTENVYDGNLEYAMDSVNAILAFREANLPTVDTQNIGMFGHSLGGGVTLAVLTGRQDLVKAAALYAPVHANVWENFSRWRTKRDDGDRTMEVFGTPENSPENWRRLSPLTYLKDINAPILLTHGSKDKDVPKEWSDFLAEALRKANKEVTYLEYEGEAHEFSFAWSDFMRKSAGFLRENLLDNDIISPLPTNLITKKPFGLYVDPTNSPVDPEKFIGFHTGTDYEAPEEEALLSVRAICNGKIAFIQKVSGYGGVLIQHCTYKGQPITVLYGHVQLSSIKEVIGDTLTAGQTFARLGKGYSAETDGERKHLHLGIHKGTEIELRGYTKTEAELDEWLNISEL